MIDVHEVSGSIPLPRTKRQLLPQDCRCGGIGRRARLRTVSGNHSRWEFESPHLHQTAAAEALVRGQHARVAQSARALG